MSTEAQTSLSKSIPSPPGPDPGVPVRQEVPVLPGPLAAADGDQGIQDGVLYSLVEAPEAQYFQIDPDTGEGEEGAIDFIVVRCEYYLFFVNLLLKLLQVLSVPPQARCTLCVTWTASRCPTRPSPCTSAPRRWEATMAHCDVE